MIVARLLHQVPGRSPVAVAIEQRADDTAIQDAGKRFIFRIRFPFRYDHVAFVCDDVDADTRTWNALFRLADWFGLDLAQAAIDGFANHPITMPVAGAFLRYTDFVEVMCPVFSRRALARCGDTFGASVSGWGLEALWTARLPYPDYRMAIVDRLRVTHTSRTRGGTLRPVLDALGVEPAAEAKTLLARHGLVAGAPRELARLSLA